MSHINISFVSICVSLISHPNVSSVSTYLPYICYQCVVSVHVPQLLSQDNEANGSAVTATVSSDHTPSTPTSQREGFTYVVQMSHTNVSFVFIFVSQMSHYNVSFVSMFLTQISHKSVVFVHVPQLYRKVEVTTSK